MQIVKSELMCIAKSLKHEAMCISLNVKVACEGQSIDTQDRQLVHAC
jgi:hypothetical protein